MPSLKERFFNSVVVRVEPFRRPPANTGEFRLIFWVIDDSNKIIFLRPPVFVDRKTRVESGTGESLRTLPFALKVIAQTANSPRIVEVDGWIRQKPPYGNHIQWKQVALGDGKWNIYISRIKLPEQQTSRLQRTPQRDCLED